MNEVRVVWLVLGAVFVLTGCEGKVRLGEEGAPPVLLPDGGVAPVSRDGGGVVVVPPASDAGMGTTVTTSADPARDAPSGEGGRDLSTDSMRFLGESRCDGLEVLLCDGFESGNDGAGPDRNTWSQPFGYLPKIDASRAARGAKSLHFTLSGTTPGHIEETRTFPATRGRLYGRMFVQFGALPTAPANAHWSIVAALGAGQDSPEVRIAGQQRHENRFGISSRAAGDNPFDWHTPASEEAAKNTASSDTWTCLEWYFGADDKETRVWVDGAELPSLHLNEREYRRGNDENGRPWAFPALERLRIGWWLYPIENPQPQTIDLWVDEVAIDDERIGCVE